MSDPAPLATPKISSTARRAAKRKGKPKARGTRVSPLRLAEVERYMLSGVPAPTFERKLAEEWHCAPSTIREYARRIVAEWATRRSSDLEEKRDSMRMRVQAFYQKALGAGAMQAAASALKLEATIDGLPITKVEHAGPGGGAIPISVDDARARVAARLEKLLRPPAPTEKT